MNCNYMCPLVGDWLPPVHWRHYCLIIHFKGKLFFQFLVRTRFEWRITLKGNSSDFLVSVSMTSIHPSILYSNQQENQLQGSHFAYLQYVAYNLDTLHYNIKSECINNTIKYPFVLLFSYISCLVMSVSLWLNLCETTQNKVWSGDYIE